MDEVLARFVHAEALGFRTAWSGQVFGHDLLTLLALAGRVTRHIELASWVVPTPTRHPAALAQQVITVQHACRGRLLLGLGVSHAAVVGRRFGIHDPRPLSRLVEVLDVLKPLLQTGDVQHAGAHHRAELQLDRLGTAPPKILLGALGPRMLALAGSRTEGAALWLAGPRTLEDFAIPRLRAAASGAGRPEPRIAVGLPVALTDDVSRARDAADAFLEPSARLPAYRRVLAREGVSRPADVAVVGDGAAIGARLDALASLGVSDFNAVTFPVPDDPDVEDRTRSWLAGRAARNA